LEPSDIDRFLEALLFIADGPAALDDLAKALEVEIAQVEEAVGRLSAALAGRGLAIVRIGSRVQMVTAPDACSAIERFLGVSDSSRLSPAALETLAIIAYRQPITRAQIDAVRGVSSDGVLRTLTAKSLIAPVGRLAQAGRPVLFGTTVEFLQYFGICSLDELPDLPELPEITIDETPSAAGELSATA
jgi:segregation and condensation protein B